MRPRWPGCRVSCRPQERRTADATLADDNFAPGCSGSVGSSLTHELPIRPPRRAKSPLSSFSTIWPTGSAAGLQALLVLKPRRALYEAPNQRAAMVGQYARSAL
jgi:hypothetical protein